MNNIAYIHVKTWVGQDPGAIHYYATITYNGKFTEVKRIIGQIEAGRLNKIEGWKFYSKGDETNRFNSERAAEQAGKKLALEKYKDVKLIVNGNPISSGPEKPLWCIKENLKARLMRCYKITEKLYAISNDPWKVDANKMDRACDKWHELLKEL